MQFRSILTYKFALALFFILHSSFFISCRDDEYITYMQDNTVGPSDGDGSVSGMYVLCQGNMGSNKATIDYLDLSNDDGNIHYLRNIYVERNPSTVKELGDVGNDIQVYGTRMWIVVNSSNKVEVCRSMDCKRIGQVDIPNCRYVAFHGDYAYVSSYTNKVYKVDTLTLQIVNQVEVGYQPEEMAVVGGKLYVANSGGYRAPDYDNTISVIDLNTFTEEGRMTVAPNLHRLRADKYGQLWVSSRGDYNDIKPSLHCIDLNSQLSIVNYQLSASDLQIVGDSLYYIGTAWSDQTQTNTKSMGLVDVKKHEVLSTDIFESPQAKGITMPYGIKVNPVTKDFYLMDAKNYISSGELLSFKADGTFQWRQWTGDIPACAVFVKDGKAIDDNPGEEPAGESPYIAGVDEYVPAPGQFINTMPLYEDGDDAKTMAEKCTKALAGNAGGMVCLGGYGGYITFHFDHPVQNVSGEYDFLIKGNAIVGNSEPGIVMVSQDTNGNGLPDDTWYELRGSADLDNVDEMVYNYQIAYTYTPMQNIPWTDNKGGNGTRDRNSYHQQEYYPLWLKDQQLTFRGTRLPNNGKETDGQWMLSAFRYGYADNQPNTNIEGCSFNIDWAVDLQTRQSVSLDHVDFIRVYNGMNQKCGWLGETSTEITGAEDLHVIIKY